jgi:hypothetical protein
MNIGGIDLDNCLLSTHTCIAYLPFVKTCNRVKMQETCNNSQNTWDSWWEWSKTHRGDRVARQVGGENGPTSEPKLIVYEAELVCALMVCGILTAVPLKRY